MEEIVVVVGMKKNYIRYMEVMLTSLLINNQECEVNFNILQNDFSVDVKEKLKERFKKYNNLKINFLDVSSELFSKFPAFGHLVIATYYRILASEVLLKYDKVLYLDIDLVVDGNILELWNTDIDNYIVAAVREESVEANEERLGIPKNYKYFNAGVLLMNLKKMREKKYFEKIMDYLNQNQETILYSDQDVLNGVFYNNWLELDKKWNYHNYFVVKKNSKKELIELDKPVIIHYTGPIKPWDKEATTILKYKYFEYENIYLNNGVKKIKNPKKNRINIFKLRILNKINKNSLFIKLKNRIKRNVFFMKIINKLSLNFTHSEKLMEVYKAKKIEMKNSLFESNFNIYLAKFLEYEKYIEIEGFAFKEGFSNRKTKKYLVFFTKNREKKYFFELATVDREICNQIYFDEKDYSSSGFFCFIKKEEIENGIYETGILIQNARLGHFKQLHKKITI